jgi:hypothetical protein
MAETKTQGAGAPEPTASKTTHRRRTERRRTAAARRETAVKRTTELSEEVLQAVEDAQRAAIEALHKFVDAVDHTLPALPHGEGPSRRQEFIDSALEMTDRLVHAQYDFARKVVDTAGKSLSRSDGAK